MAESKKNWAKWLGEKGTSVYLFMMLAVFPMFFTSMFHLTKDKRDFFLALSFCYACTLLPSIRKPCLKADTIFIMILLLAVAASTLLSGDISKAFWKISDRSINGICFLGCILAYLGVQRYGAYGKTFLFSWMAGSSLVYLSGILCACGVDFMHIQDNLPLPENYLTPLGNTNYNTCYVCLMLPLIMAMYMVCRGKVSRILYGVYLYMGFLFTIFIKTQSAALAVMAGMVILLCFALEKQGWLRKYAEIAGIYLGAKATVIVLLHLSGGRMYPFSRPSRVFLEGKWVFWESLYFLAILSVYRLKGGKLRQWAAGKRKIFLCVAAFAAAVLVFCVILANAKKGTIPGTSFLSEFTIRDRSFTNRGFIWRRTLRELKREPLVNKVFGNGLNCFYKYFLPAKYQEKSFRRFGWYYLDPHSEWLQMLVDMGLLGAAGYFGLLGAALAKALRNWKKDEWMAAAALVLCVYMVQGLANAYTIYNLPLLFIFLGMVNSQCGSGE